MQFVNEPIPGCCYTGRLLGLQFSEVRAIAKAIEKPLQACRKRLDRLADIHESGEATTKQEDLRIEIEEQVSILENFINKQKQWTYNQ